MSLADRVEQTLRAYRLPGLEEALPADTFVLPHYGGYSIANIPATVAAMLGTELEGAMPPIPAELWADLADGVRHVVLVILDGVGYRYMRQMLADAGPGFRHLAEMGRLFPLTSVFPSTTVTALTTLRTGQAPLGHGFLGTRLLIGEYGVMAFMLTLGPAASKQREELLRWGWEPDEFVTAPTLAERLSAAGVPTIAYTYHHFVNGALSRIFLRGVGEVRGYAGFSDQWIDLRQTLVRHQDERVFVSAYWANFDSLSHLYGPRAEAGRADLRHLARALEEDLLDPLPAAAREGTLLMFVADHGEVSTPPARVVRLADHPDLQQMLLLPPGGETRAAFLYARPGQADGLRAYVAAHLADQFVPLETERALAAGLFGPGEATPELQRRLGDLLLLARGDSRLVGPKDLVEMPGHHGSLMPEEMLVPLLLMRLDG